MRRSAPASLSQDAGRISRLLTALAAALACFIAVVLPLILFSARYSIEESSLSAEAERGAALLSRHIYSNAALWQFETLRLEEILSEVQLAERPLRRRVIAADSGILIDTAEALPGPNLMRSAEIHDGQRVAGRLEIEQSLRPLLTRSAVEAALSIVLGLAVFMVVRLIPVRSVRKTFARLSETQASLIGAVQLAEAGNKAKTEFLATMSHELRTPLNAVIGFSDMMARQVLGPIGTPAYLDYARDIHSSGQLLLSIINDVLDLTKIAAGAKLDLAEESVDIAAAIDFALGVVGPQADAGQVALDNRSMLGLPALRGDPRRVRQMLLNLLSNAIKFTLAGGTVTIEAQHRRSGELSIEVRDTGIGIAAQDLARVLKPFEQVATIYSRHHDGTGLGLPLTKELVEAHGGTLLFTSKIGVGTSAVLLFPAERLAGDDTAGEKTAA